MNAENFKLENFPVFFCMTLTIFYFTDSKFVKNSILSLYQLMVKAGITFRFD